MSLRRNWESGNTRIDILLPQGLQISVRAVHRVIVITFLVLFKRLSEGIDQGLTLQCSGGLRGACLVENQRRRRAGVRSGV
jgi:hypothetical protein